MTFIFASNISLPPLPNLRMVQLKAYKPVKSMENPIIWTILDYFIKVLTFHKSSVTKSLTFKQSQ